MVFFYQPGLPSSKILHVTDIHLDPTYTVGSTGVNCNSTMCCTNYTQMAPSDPDDETGYWGMVSNCDLPTWTFRSMLESAKADNPVS